MGGNVHTNMFRASKIFVFEERPSESPFIEKFWGIARCAVEFE
jgi:hypothetical protein